ncbi:MAG: DNA primase [Fervidobacterium sp.]|nr:DNA primase [Fervidobacterium sp.]
MISREVIEKIKEKCDIVDVISEYVSLQKVGANYRGLCPFHTETSPSFYVNTSRKMYHCFGCGESGDVIKFIEKLENLSYVEAVQKLASRIGMKVDFSQEDSSKALYYEFYKFLHEQYKSKLESAQNIIEYLEKRGFSKREISLYEFGFSPVNSNIPQLAANKLGIDKERLASFGFSYNDPFSGRIIIPIKDDFGKVIAFGGRLVGDGIPKYINSQETFVFKKSSVLFMFNVAKEYIKEMDYVVICEGYFDALAFHRAGIKNAVATLGTTLSKTHISKLRKYTSNIILAFDSDNAGIKAALKNIELLIPDGFNVVVAAFDQAKDADETFHKFGSQGLLNVLGSALSPEVYVVNQFSKMYDLSNPNGVNSFLKAVSYWESVFSRNAKILDNFHDRVSVLTGIERSKVSTMLQSSFQQLNNITDQRSANIQEIQTRKIDSKRPSLPSLEDYLVYIYYNYPELFKQLEFSPDLLEGNVREFFLIAKDLNDLEDQLSKDMMKIVKSSLDKIDVPIDDKVIQSIKRELEIRKIDKRIVEIDALIGKSQNEDEKRILLKARIELIKQKEKIKRSSN